MQDTVRLVFAAAVGYILTALPPCLTARGQQPAPRQQGTPAANAAPKRDTERKPSLPADPAARLEQALASPVPLSFRETPLSEVLSLIRAQRGIQIYVDRQAIEEEGLSVDDPVTVDFEGVPLGQALSYVLRQVGLAYYVDGSVLVVTTQTAAGEHIELRAYPVGDLLAALRVTTLDDLLTHTGVLPGRLRPGPSSGDRMWIAFGQTGSLAQPAPAMGQASGAGGAGGGAFDEEMPPTNPGRDSEYVALLRQLITSSCAPDTWLPAGGNGTISSYGATLVIGQTREVHAQIEQLLTELRQRLQTRRKLVLEARWYLATSEAELQQLVNRLALRDSRFSGRSEARTTRAGQTHVDYGMPGQRLPSTRDVDAGVTFGRQGGMYGGMTYGEMIAESGYSSGGAGVASMGGAMAGAQARTGIESGRLIAVARVPCLLGQRLAFVGGEVAAITAAVTPVVGDGVAANQIDVREALVGIRGEFALLPSDDPDQVVLRARFTLAKRLQPERGVGDAPDRYRASLASTDVHVPLRINRPTAVAVLPCDQEPQTHVVLVVSVVADGTQ